MRRISEPLTPGVAFIGTARDTYDSQASVDNRQNHAGQSPYTGPGLQTPLASPAPASPGPQAASPPSPLPGPSAGGTVRQGQAHSQLGNRAFVNLLNKASKEVKRDILTNRPPLEIDTAVIFGILKSEQMEKHVKDGTTPRSRFDYRNGVTVAGVARRFGNNPHTVGTYVDATGRLTARGEKNVGYHYKNYSDE